LVRILYRRGVAVIVVAVMDLAVIVLHVAVMDLFWGCYRLWPSAGAYIPMVKVIFMHEIFVLVYIMLNFR